MFELTGTSGRKSEAGGAVLSGIQSDPRASYGSANGARRLPPQSAAATASRAGTTPPFPAVFKPTSIGSAFTLLSDSVL